MHEKKSAIKAAFEDVVDLFTELGYFAEGNRNDGTYVRFWRNGNLREITQYKDGTRDGICLSYDSNRILTSAVHRKKANKYGETVILRRGLVLKTVFISNGVETREKDADKAAFGNYVITKDKLCLFEQFQPLGSFLRTYVQ